MHSPDDEFLFLNCYHDALNPKEKSQIFKIVIIMDLHVPIWQRVQAILIV